MTTFHKIITSFQDGKYLNDQCFSKEELVNNLNNYSKCTCCERHQVNRPCSPSEFVEGISKVSYKTHECECDCRHLSRFICRYMIDTYKEVPKITTEKEM